MRLAVSRAEDGQPEASTADAPGSDARTSGARTSGARGCAVRARAVLDRTGTMPGRGAYVCRDKQPNVPRPACLELAVRRGGVARALRQGVKFDLEILELVGQ